jgi:hypothetical protein
MSQPTASTPTASNRAHRLTRQAKREAKERQLMWLYRRLTSRLRALPEFLIIGAQRCGTTSTYSYICEHPRVRRAWLKEVRFFDSPRYYARGEGWYRAHFPRRPRGIISGEATPEYMLRAEARERMARHVPGARLIALVRNPVDRALSHYHHQVRHGLESRTFEAALDEQAVSLPAPPEGNQTYLARGLYAEQIEAVLRFFPREQLLVLPSEDLFADAGAAMARIFAFLGLPPADVSLSARLSAGAYGGMPPAVRARLVEFFRPHNARLYDLLGRDLGWDR